MSLVPIYTQHRYKLKVHILENNTAIFPGLSPTLATSNKAL